MKFRILITLVFGSLFLSSCAFFQNEVAVKNFDLNKVSCQEIDSARTKVLENYKSNLKFLADAYTLVREKFEKDAADCRMKVYLQNPCEEDWQNLQNAYQTARGNISNDEAYNNYKSNKAKWEACIENHQADPNKFYDEGEKKLEMCNESYQKAISQALSVKKAEEEKLTNQKNSDLAFLDDLEKKCATPAPEPSITPVISVNSGNTTGNNVAGGAVSVGNSASGNGGGCLVPGENTTPRTGKPDENVVKDIATEIAIQVAEGITGSPIPSSAINDKIFAGIVCTKLYARELELQQEEIDAILSNNRVEMIKIRRTLAKYRRAKQVWCAIAEGRTNAKQVRTAALEIEKMPGTSEGEMCAYLEDTIIEKKAVKINALPHAGTYLPIDSLVKFKGPECDKEEHWHIHGSAVAMDGRSFFDPNPNDCGLGKTKNLQPVEVEVFEETSDLKIAI